MLGEQGKVTSPVMTLPNLELSSPFKIVRNHRRNQIVSDPHHHPEQGHVSAQDSQSQIGSTKKTPSANDPHRKRRIKKQRKGKKYSEESQNKRDIRLRYADSEDSEEGLVRQTALWNQLWMPQVKVFAKSGENHLAEIFRIDLELQQPPSTPIAVQERRQMHLPPPLLTVSKQGNVVLERSPSAVGQKNELEMDSFDYMALRFRYENESFNQNEDSNDFFFERHHLNQHSP